ncbi:hypothetical protein [Ralstonia solanacearum]|uniref:hypothetical protein n=1 Tax=Ralstonia solanacearum TaxID=305 RepID=UPI0012D40327|nr:hypothetical protein [Ralstonia solanacearum]
MKKIGLHFVLICLVVIIPPLLFERMAWAKSDFLQCIGGITYPLYIGYWISRVKRERIRIMLFHIMDFFVFVPLCIISFRWLSEGVYILALPIALLPSLILAIAMLFRRQVAVAGSHFYSFLLLLPLALFAEYWLLQAFALSIMRGLRY